MKTKNKSKIVVFLIATLVSFGSFIQEANAQGGFKYSHETFTYHRITVQQGSNFFGRLQFIGANFRPCLGTHFGTMFLNAQTQNIPRLELYLETPQGPRFICHGVAAQNGFLPLQVWQTPRGGSHTFTLVGKDFHGNIIAKDHVTFNTPPPNITVQQWVQRREVVSIR